MRTCELENANLYKADYYIPFCDLQLLETYLESPMIVFTF